MRFVHFGDFDGLTNSDHQIFISVIVDSVAKFYWFEVLHCFPSLMSVGVSSDDVEQFVRCLFSSIQLKASEKENNQRRCFLWSLARLGFVRPSEGSDLCSVWISFKVSATMANQFPHVPMIFGKLSQ